MADFAEAGIGFLAGQSVRAGSLVLMVLVTVWLLRKHEPRVRARLWAAVMVCLLLLPVAAVLVPSVNVAVLPGPEPANGLPGPEAFRRPELPWPGDPPYQPEVPAPSPSAPSSAPASPRADASRGADRVPQDLAHVLIMGVYLAGLLAATMRLVHARLGSSRMLRDARTTSHQLWPAPAGIDVRESEQIQSPIIIGAFSPVVLVPAAGRSWSPEWRGAAIEHELAHIRARDPWMQVLSEIAVVLHWFNPLVHLAARQLRIERELAADQAAVANGIAETEYAAMLFALACLPASGPRCGALVPLLTPAGLKTRVARVLVAARPRTVSSVQRVALGAAGLLVASSLAIAVPVPRSRPTGAIQGVGPVVGRLVDDGSSTPVAGAEVRFIFGGWSRATVKVESDENGQFRYPWDEPLPDEFRIYARRDTRAARQVIHAVPFGTKLPTTIALRSAPTLSGTVRTPAGEPIENAKVAIWFDELTNFGPGREVVVTSDEAGVWQLHGILPGEYRLLVTAPWGVKTTVPVAVKDVDRPNVRVRIPRDWPVTAYFRSEDGEALGDLQISTNAHFVMTSIWPAVLRVPVEPERYVDWDRTTADGAGRLIPTGRHMSIAGRHPDGTTWFGEYVAMNAASTGSGVPVVIMRRSVSLTGTVRRPRGEPVGGVWVQVVTGFPVDDAATTDEQGRFVIPVAPPVPHVTLAAFELGSRGGEIRARVERRLDLSLPMSSRPVELVLP